MWAPQTVIRTSSIISSMLPLWDIISEKISWKWQSNHIDLLHDCWHRNLLNLFKIDKYVAFDSFTSYFKNAVGDNGEKLLMLFERMITYGFFTQSYCKNLFSLTDLSLELTDFFLEVLFLLVFPLNYFLIVLVTSLRWAVGLKEIISLNRIGVTSKLGPHPGRFDYLPGQTEQTQLSISPSYVKCCSSFVDIHWTHSSTSLFLFPGLPNPTKYSRCGLTNAA